LLGFACGGHTWRRRATTFLVDPRRLSDSSWIFGVYFVIFELYLIYFEFFIFVICSCGCVRVKIVKSGVWVFVSFFMCFFIKPKRQKRKKLKRQEEFNVLIRSWLRITSLYVRHIPDIQ